MEDFLPEKQFKQAKTVSQKENRDGMSTQQAQSEREVRNLSETSKENRSSSRKKSTQHVKPKIEAKDLSETSMEYMSMIDDEDWTRLRPSLKDSDVTEYSEDSDGGLVLSSGGVKNSLSGHKSSKNLKFLPMEKENEPMLSAFELENRDYEFSKHVKGKEIDAEESRDISGVSNNSIDREKSTTRINGTETQGKQSQMRN